MSCTPWTACCQQGGGPHASVNPLSVAVPVLQSNCCLQHPWRIEPSPCVISRASNPRNLLISPSRALTRTLLDNYHRKARNWGTERQCGTLTRERNKKERARHGNRKNDRLLARTNWRLLSASDPGLLAYLWALSWLSLLHCCRITYFPADLTQSS